MGIMQDSIMDSTVQNLQTLQHHAGLNMERGLRSVPAGHNDHSCSYYGAWCLVLGNINPGMFFGMLHFGIFF